MRQENNGIDEEDFQVTRRLNPGIEEPQYDKMVDKNHNKSPTKHTQACNTIPSQSMLANSKRSISKSTDYIKKQQHCCRISGVDHTAMTECACCADDRVDSWLNNDATNHESGPASDTDGEGSSASGGGYGAMLQARRDSLKRRQHHRRCHSVDESRSGTGPLRLRQELTELALTAADKAEELVYRAVDLLHHHKLPAWLKDNDYLIWGHRPQLHTFSACFSSIFRLHTETVNIWTHLLGCLGFIIFAIVFYLRPSIGGLEEKFVFLSFFIGAILCLGFSWIYHTVHCHSEHVGRIFNKLDYCGITLLTVGSCIPWIHYSFYCYRITKLFYLVLIVLLGGVCMCVSFVDRFRYPEYRPLRAALFVGLGLSGVVPCLHYIALEGFWDAWSNAALAWLLLMAAFYISGAVIYATRVPERFFPGKFDIWFQSHSIFHVFVVIAAVIYCIGIRDVIQHRQTQGLCIADAKHLNHG